MTLSKTQIALLQSYGRSFVAAALALYMSGATDWQSYVYALVAAFAPVAIRYFNKNDIAFGRGATPDSLATEAVKVLETVIKAKPATKKTVAKAPAKKTPSPAKKSTVKAAPKKK
jgi:hypothetical protein